MNHFDRLVTMGLKAQLRLSGREIVYYRGTQSATFRAIKGRHVEQAVDGTTVMAETEHTDWIFAMENLAAFSPAEPGKGDYLIDDAGLRHELMEKIGTGWWQHIEPSKTWARVTTTETQT